MIYFKSILVGIAAFILTIILYVTAWIIYIQFYLVPKIRRSVPTGELGFDLRSINLPLGLIIAVLAFGAGFYWMLNRISK